jgi:chromosome segregation ATPase
MGIMNENSPKDLKEENNSKMMPDIQEMERQRNLAIEDAKQQIRYLNTELATKQDAINQLVDEINALKDKKLNPQLYERDQNNLIASLRENQEKAGKQIIELREDIKQLNDEIFQLKSECAVLRATNEELNITCVMALRYIIDNE